MKKFSFYSTLLGCIFYFTFIFSGYVLAAPQEIASLKEFSGEVMIKNAETWTQPEKGLLLYSGAKIVTKQGTALVTFNDGATMYVDAFSSIRVMDQMKNLISGSDKPVRLRSIRIMLGRTKYEEQPDKGRKTEIQMPTAVAALRGTGGWFGADETGESQGTLYDGNMNTFGVFKEMVPKILTFAQALNSPTWQASLTSSGASDNAVLNVQEIRAELNTFMANTNPAIRESVRQTLDQVYAVLDGFAAKQEKVQAAQTIKVNSTHQMASATPGTDQKVIAANQISGQTADAYVEATKESLNADIVLILEIMKGDPTGIETATQAKAQNDQALNIAENATKTAENAAALANSATNDTQRDVALSSATTALNTIGTAASAIKTSNASVWLAARDDATGTDKTKSLSSSAAQTLATAEKSGQLADKAIVAATTAQTEQEKALAQNLATSAQKSSGAVLNALKVNNLAAQAVKEQNSEQAETLAETAETAAQSVAVVDAAMDATNTAFENNDTDGMNDAINNLNDAVQEILENTQEAIGEAAPDAAEKDADEEPADEEPADEEPADEEPFIDDTRPASPV